MLNRVQNLTFVYTLVALLALALLISVSAPVQAGSTCGVPSQYGTIQAAVDDPDCSDVEVAAGTYYENVVITRDVSISGDAKGDTIIDGGGNGSVFFIEPPVDVSLFRLIIQNGYVGETPYSGGGVANVEGSVTISKSIIRNNAALVHGGGIWNGRGRLTVSDTTITGNRATRASGGGILSTNGSLTVYGSTISGNYAEWGAGIAADGQVTVRRTTVRNNEAVTSGGGITIANGATAELTHSIVRGNQAAYGGGVLNSGKHTNLLIFKSQINRNHADQGGGGIANGFSATLTLQNSEVLENTAGELGGDLFNVEDSTVFIKNSKVGDIYNDDSSTIVR